MKSGSSLAWLLCVAAVVMSVSRAEEDVISCGGFIKSSRDDLSVDYSKMEIKLYTKEGNLKYSTDPAPNNGYYMIPVYSKGDYTIRLHPPAGWHFNPKEMEVTIDGSTDPCSKGEDINFVLAGFTVTGKVKNLASSTGPSGFKLSLLDSKTRKEVSSTVTQEGGSYGFNEVLPGSYSIVLDGGESCVADKERKISVEAGPTNTQQDIYIQGYSLTGSVVDGSDPVEGATFYLLSATAKKLDCQASKKSDKVGNLHRLCQSVSNEAGQVLFPCIPPGEYQVLPEYEKAGTVFHVEPQQKMIRMESGRQTMDEPFRIAGFSVTGRALLSSAAGKPVPAVNAEILLNGESAGRTGSNGEFRLEKVAKGSYSIECRLDNVEFAAQNLQLNPKQTKIPDFVANKFNVCGHVDLSSGGEAVRMKQRKLTVSGGVGGKKSTESSSITTDKDGKFCRMLSPGKYVLQAQILPDEREAGIMLVPDQHEITVSSAPVTDILFSQFRASVTGQLTCLSPTKSIELFIDRNGQQIGHKVLNGESKTHQFKFDGLVPGKYTVRIGESVGLCWEGGESKDIVVKTADLSGVNFKQSGYALAITSTHAAKLNWASLQKETVKNGMFDLAAGKNQLCLPISGSYQMRVESCHRMEPADEFTYSTNNPTPVSLHAAAHRVSGKVRSKATKIQSDLFITIKWENSGESRRIGPLSKGGNEVAFELMANPDETLTLTPESKLLIFTPTTKQIDVQGDCISDIVLEAEAGKFVEGSIIPSLANVEILFNQGEHQQTVKTDAQGKYKIGPLRSIEGVEVEAVLVGYVFKATPDNAYDFKAFKLSELTIEVVGGDGKGLEGVLVSLSGGTDYRSNSLTEASGRINFIGLSPGEYFIRAVLKEFSFTPASHMVKIREGSGEKVSLRAKRVAFSAMGVVEQLGGEPLEAATIEAIAGEECNKVQEEGVSKSDGTWRIRGLVPGCNYQVRVKSKTNQIQDTIPRAFTLTVADRDVEGHRFVVAPVWTTMEVSGFIKLAKREWLKSLKLTLLKDDQPDSPVQTVTFSTATNFFLQNIPIDNQTYTIRLESSLPKSQFDIVDAQTAAFKADTQFKIINFNFEPKRKRIEAEIARSGLILFPVIGLIALAVYHRAKLVPLVLDGLQNVRDRIKESGLEHARSQSRRRSPSSHRNLVDPMVGGGYGGSDLMDLAGATSRRRGKARKT